MATDVSCMQGGASQLCSKMELVGSWKLTDFLDRSVRVIIVPDLFDAVVQRVLPKCLIVFSFLPLTTSRENKFQKLCKDEDYTKRN